VDLCTTFNQLLDLRQPLKHISLDRFDLEEQTQATLIVAKPLMQNDLELKQRRRLGLVEKLSDFLRRKFILVPS
jgi:hypothetical protein